MSEKNIEAKSFELLLLGADDAVKDRYLEYLREARAEGEKANKGGLYFVPYAEREELLKQAEISVRNHVDVRKMRKAWDRAGGDENPPIGGAQRD